MVRAAGLYVMPMMVCTIDFCRIVATAVETAAMRHTHIKEPIASVSVTTSCQSDLAAG